MYVCRYTLMCVSGHQISTAAAVIHKYELPYMGMEN